eukprot:498315-Prymnesium_polylepis.1
MRAYTSARATAGRSPAAPTGWPHTVRASRPLHWEGGAALVGGVPIRGRTSRGDVGGRVDGWAGGRRVVLPVGDEE